MFVKVCGITNEADALLAVAMGADAIGFDFSPTEHQIAPRVAGEIAKRLPPEIHTVGVFRDQDARQIAHVINTYGLAAAQLDGHESPEFTRDLARLIPAVIKGFRADETQLVEANQWGTRAIIVHAEPSSSHDTAVYQGARHAPRNQRVIISGGLTATNFEAAAHASLASGFNITTGVETSPGRISPVLLAQAVVAAKAVRAPLREQLCTPFDWQNVPTYARGSLLTHT